MGTGQSEVDNPILHESSTHISHYFDISHPLNAYGFSQHMALAWPQLQDKLTFMKELSKKAGEKVSISKLNNFNQY